MKTGILKILIVCFLVGEMFAPNILRGQSIESFTLINAENGDELGQLQSNQTINLATLPEPGINIRANINPEFSGRVEFYYDGVFFRTERVAPYALAGDINGVYNTWTPAIGNHTLTAIPYSDTNSNGVAGQPMTIVFSVIESAGTPVDESRVVINGELKKWHRVTLTFSGPAVNEGSTPNPFLDYRLNVTFTHSSGKQYIVPGYFAADGNAAETSASSGNKWRAHFAPDEPGSWTYRVSFRSGQNIAVSDDPNQGVAISSLDGITNLFYGLANR